MIETLEDMQRAKKLLSVSRVKELFSGLEPIRQVEVDISTENNITISLPEFWNEGLKSLDDSIMTSATLEMEGSKYMFMKRAILMLASAMGISESYVYRIPGPLLETHMNHWLRNSGVWHKDTIKFLIKDKYVVGVAPESKVVVYNSDILDYVVRSLRKKSDGTTLFVEPNLTNLYTETSYNILLPEVAFTVDADRNGKKERDHWHFGIHVSNSLVSASRSPLSVSGAMYEHNSGIVILPEHSQIAVYPRTADGSPEDVKGWIDSSIDQIKAILPVEAETIQDMVNHELQDVGETLTDIFRTLKVPRKVQETTVDILTDEGDLTAYGVMVALAKAGLERADNLTGTTFTHVQRVAGLLPSRTDSLCNSCGRIHMLY